MVDAAVGRHHSFKNSISSCNDVHIARYRFKSCPDYSGLSKASYRKIT